MEAELAAIVLVIFLLAGAVKGVIGLGLPTVSLAAITADKSGLLSGPTGVGTVTIRTLPPSISPASSVSTKLLDANSSCVISDVLS